MGFGIPPRAADKNFPVCEACEKDLENVQGWHNEIQLRWSQIERTMTNVLAKILSSSPPDEAKTNEGCGQEEGGGSRVTLEFRESTRLSS